MKKTTVLLLAISLGFLLRPDNFTFAQEQAMIKRDFPLRRLRGAPAFRIQIYANNVPYARQMALGSQGTIFVGTRDEGKVYALVDTDGNYVADLRYDIAENLNSPNGVAFRDGDLYVAEIHRVIRFDDIEENLNDPPEPIVINDSFPDDEWHGWKYIKFGPDDKLYVPVGAPCNVCEKEDARYATIMRMNPDGSELEIFAKGVRNSVGFDFHPETGELYFTDNGRDLMGDDVPPDELNHAPEPGMHFGFPYCHGADISDPEFGDSHSCDEFTPPIYEFQAHIAALGVDFYEGDMFPDSAKGRLFVAAHGSWNRSTKVGYHLGAVRFKSHNRITYGILVDGWEKDDSVIGRPVDVLEMPDGSMLISDDYAGIIYRLVF